MVRHDDSAPESSASFDTAWSFRLFRKQAIEHGNQLALDIVKWGR